MGCEHLDDYYELYLLGLVPEGAGEDIHDHAASGCVYCMEHLREATLSIYLLTLAAKPLRPDPKLKARVLRRSRKK